MPRGIYTHKPNTLEQNIKIGLALKGRKQSLENRLKNSEAKKRMWADPTSAYHSKNRSQKIHNALVGKPSNNPHGVRYSTEGREKLSKLHTGRHLTNEWKRNISLGMLGRIFTEETRDKIRQSRIRFMSSGKNPLCDTYIEKIFEHELKFMNVSYRKQVPLLGRTVVDFLLPEKVVVYCDGEYWHNLPGRRDMDKRQTSLLETNGYSVYRFTGKELKNDVKRCLQTILRKSYLCDC